MMYRKLLTNLYSTFIGYYPEFIREYKNVEFGRAILTGSSFTALVVSFINGRSEFVLSSLVAYGVFRYSPHLFGYGGVE